MGLPAARQTVADICGELARGPAFVLLDNFETPLQGTQREALELAAQMARVEGVAVAASLRDEPPGGVAAWAEFDELQRLDEAAARAVFTRISGLSEPMADLDYLLRELDGLPLALVLVAQQAQILRDFPSLQSEDVRAVLEFAASRERKLAGSSAG